MGLLKTFTKFLIAFAFLASLAVTVRAENYTIPVDNNGFPPSDVNLAGVDVIDATGTRAYGITTPGVLYWVYFSSTNASLVVTTRDSDTLNTSSHANLTLKIAATGGTTAGTMVTLSPPVIFRNGMSVLLSEAVLGTGRVSFGFRRRNIGNMPGKDVAVSATSASD